ncbi:MAG TPA: hypothetical protein VGA77_10515 [Propylenella sp.]
MSRSVADRQGGFALIESIAVLALSALVLLTLLIAADVVTRNSAAAIQRAEAVEILATGLTALRRDLEDARHVRIDSPASPPPLLFSGSAQALGLVTAGDGTGPDDRESLVWIEARYEEGRGVLVRSTARVQPGIQSFGDAAFRDPVFLVSGPWMYRFSYADGRRGSLFWQSAWTSPVRMPAAIRLEVLDATGSARVVPPVVVHLRVTQDNGCDGEACTEEWEDDDSVE